MIPQRSIEDKGATALATGEVPLEQPLTILGLWWRWVLATAGIGTLCWVGVVAVATIMSPFGRYLAGLVVFIAIFFLGRTQGALLRKFVPQSLGPDRAQKAWKAATMSGFAIMLLATPMLPGLTSTYAAAAGVTSSMAIAGAVLGALTGTLQTLVLRRYCPNTPARWWLPANILALAGAALAWWFVFALTRADGPRITMTWFGPRFSDADGLSVLASGVAATLVLATVTATGVASIFLRLTRQSNVPRDLAIGGGLTVVTLLGIFALSVPSAGRATSIVTTVINPTYYGPTPTIEASMLGPRSMSVTAQLCGTWHYELLPPDDNSGMGRGGLADVDVVSENEAWAVYGASLLRWQGNTWTVGGGPDLGNYAGMPVRIEGIAPDDVWLAGADNTSNSGRSWFAHWDGISWTAVAGPPERVSPLAIAAVAPDDIWAAGSRYANSGSDEGSPGILHWDGAAWRAMPGPDDVQTGRLYGVAAATVNDAWAVGQFGGSSVVPGALTIHWDGSKWRQVRNAAPGMGSDNLSAVVALAQDDVWAVGTFLDVGAGPPARWAPGVIHWDGQAWGRIPPGQLGSALVGVDGGLYDVAASSPDNVWAAGYSDGRPLLLHWDGQQWSVLPGPNVRGEWRHLAVTAGTIWAVGSSSAVLGYESVPMLGRFVREACPAMNP